MPRAIMALVLVLALPGTGLADGMSFVTVSVAGSAEVHATRQRAALWQRDGTWEVHIQPVFDRERAGAAWVVPFPVRPEVHPGSADFLDQLEILTTPVFLEVCERYEDDTGCGFLGCGAVAEGDAGALDYMHAEAAGVIEWDRGSVGQLDYVTLSATSGDSLAGWLDAEGYAVPAGAGALLQQYQAEGAFFFAARLSADVDPAVPLSPVRFVLPELASPSYPLRLTALGVPPGETLDLTLWVITSDGYPKLPSSHSYDTLGYVETREQYQAELDRFFLRQPDALAVVYGEALLWNTRLTRRAVCLDYEHHCLSLEQLGIEVPADWSEEIQEIEQTRGAVHRYLARLRADAMRSDLHLADYTDHFGALWEDAVYEHYTCEAEQGTVGVGAVAVGVVLLLARRRRRR